MAMVSHDGAPSREILAEAIAGELARQGARQVDVEALVDVIRAVIDRPAEPSEGRRPEDLNATNDD